MKRESTEKEPRARQTKALLKGRVAGEGAPRVPCTWAGSRKQRYTSGVEKFFVLMTDLPGSVGLGTRGGCTGCPKRRKTHVAIAK